MLKRVMVIAAIALSLTVKVPVADATCWICQYSNNQGRCLPTEAGYSWCFSDGAGSCVLGEACGGWDVERARRLERLTEKDALKIIMMIYREQMKSLTYGRGPQVAEEKATNTSAQLPASLKTGAPEAR